MYFQRFSFEHIDQEEKHNKKYVRKPTSTPNWHVAMLRMITKLNHINKMIDEEAFHIWNSNNVIW